MKTISIAEKNQMEREQQACAWNFDWMIWLEERPLFLVFDTETSGLDPWDNDILSLSWQLIDASKNFEVIDEQTFYFDWVSEERTSMEAIRVNGLTREKLAGLGTVARKEGLEAFAAALNKADFVVAHNYKFDRKFVIATARREGTFFSLKKPYFCTMLQMTDFCRLPGYIYGSLKWPKLSELARCLKIDDSDIDYHQSCADVELTKRCFINIVSNGLWHNKSLLGQIK